MTPRRFGIARHEAIAAWWLTLHLFLTVASTVIGKAARDAIFLGRFSPLQMTLVDLVTMVGIALIVGAQLRLTALVSMRRVLLLSPCCFAIGDVVLWAGLMTAHAAWMTWATYLWIGAQASFGTPHASVLASHVLPIRRARRLYGLIGAGSILGWIGGGLATQMLAAQWGAPSLLLGAAALTSLCPVAVAAAWRRAGRVGGPSTIDAGAEDPLEHSSLRASASLVWTSPHLRAIAVLAFVSSAVTTIAALQFRIIASESIHATDHLAAFFGAFSVRAGLVALALQVLLTTRLLDRLGIGPALAIAPAAIAAGSAGVLYSGTLLAAVMLKGSDQVLRYSVDRSAVELLYRPLPPREIFEGKTFIDALVCRFGDAAGAVMALFGAVALHLSFRHLSLISIMLVLTWLASAELARRRYRARLLERIQRRPGRHSGLPIAHHRAPIADPRGVLDPDPATRLQVLRALTRVLDPRLAGAIDPALLSTALGAEIVGFTILIDGPRPPGQSWAEHRLEGVQAIERISRLLFLINPDRYPGCVLSALGSRNRATEAAALEYLDTTLASPHRQLLVAVLDRWMLTAA